MMLSLTGKCRDGKGKACGRDGVMRLIAPDGLLVPGCFMCRDHAEECVREYAAKLGGYSELGVDYPLLTIHRKIGIRC